jgi:hypothetical protein
MSGSGIPSPAETALVELVSNQTTELFATLRVLRSLELDRLAC